MGVYRLKPKREEDPNFKFTEEFIQESLNKFFSPNSVKYNIDGLYVFEWESDKLLETKSGYMYEFEIKVSRADFKNDFKHKREKHIILEGAEKYPDKYLPKYYELLDESRKRGGRAEEYFHRWADNSGAYLAEGHRRPNYFYYAVPTDLIKEDEVPQYAGLIYVNQWGGISAIKKAPCLHKDKYTDEELNFAEKFYYNMVHWRNKFKKEKREKEYSQKRLLQEIKAKGQGTAYADLERQYKELEKTHKEYVESRSKTDSQLHRDLYRQNMAVRLLAREVQKHDPNFNFWTWTDEHLGKE